MSFQSPHVLYRDELHRLRRAGVSSFRRDELGTLRSLASRLLEAETHVGSAKTPAPEDIDRVMLALVEHSIRAHSVGSEQHAVLTHFGFLQPSGDLLSAAGVMADTLVRHGSRARLARHIVAYSEDHYRDKVLNPTINAVSRTLVERPPDLVELRQRPPAPAAGRSAFSVVSHKFIPVWVGLSTSTKLSEALGAGRVRLRGLEAVELAVPSIPHAVLFRFGVLVVHIEESLTFTTITDLARWRRQSYIDAEALVHQKLDAVYSRVVPGHTTPRPSHVLSLYYLHSYGWPDSEHRPAVSLLAMPSVLLERPDEVPVPHADHAREDRYLREGIVSGELRDFGVPLVSHAFAGWAGVAYAPIDLTRAVPEDALVELELLLQAAWCYADVVARSDNSTEGVSVRTHFHVQRALLYADPHESTQLCIAREAMVATSRVASLLEAAREVLLTITRSA